MAEVNLGNDTSLNVSLGEQTNLSTTVYDLNYIPDYVKAEQERRANETIRITNEETRQDNEQDRIALYEDLLNKVATDYFKGEKGDTGETPSISANASITGGVGTPSVSITRSGTDENPILSFAFENLKGDKGDAGAIKFEIVASLPTTEIQEDTIYLLPITPDEDDNNYEEYIYVNGEWELLGKIGVHIDLSDYVKNTDYAGSGNNKGGTVVLKTTYNVDTNASGVLYCFNKTYSQYGSMDNSSFISKGTLENVITGKDLTTKSYVDGLVGDIADALDLINGESV